MSAKFLIFSCRLNALSKNTPYTVFNALNETKMHKQTNESAARLNELTRIV